MEAPLPGPEPVVAVHAVLLHAGRVLMVEADSADLWSPRDGSHRRVDLPNLFCSGHALLADGEVLFVGGHTGGEDHEGPPGTSGSADKYGGVISVRVVLVWAP